MKSRILVPLMALGAVSCGGGNKAANNQNAAAPAANGQNATATSNASAPTAGGALTPQEVRTMVQRDGAAATVRALNEGGTAAAPNRFAALERGIASGDQQWLEIVPLIRPGTDGETGEGLSTSLADALPRNAAGVLRVSGTPDEVASVCDPVAFEEMSPERRTYVQTAITAVEAVSDPALQQVKASCLTTLRSSLQAQ